MKPLFIFLFAISLISQKGYALDHLLKIKIENQTSYDETIVRFLPNATNGYDNGSDAQKMLSPNPSVPGMYTKCDSVTKLAINALPMLSGSKSVNIYLRIGVPGTYSIKSQILGSFDHGTAIYLHDLEMDTWHEFSNGQAHTFELPVITENSSCRFEIYFSTKAVVTQVSPVTCDYLQNGSITFKKPSDILWKCVVKDLLDNTIMEMDSIKDSITVNDLASGDYRFEIYSVASGSDTGAFTIGAVNTIDVGFTYSIDYTPHEAIVTFDNISTGPNTYHWNFGDGTTSQIQHPVHYYYEDTVYTIELTAQSGNCVKSYSLEIEISNYVLTQKKIKSPQSEMIVLVRNDGISVEGLVDESEAILSVYSINGGEIYNQKVSSGNYSAFVALKQSGMYVINITTQSSSFTKRIVHLIN